MQSSPRSTARQRDHQRDHLALALATVLVSLLVTACANPERARQIARINAMDQLDLQIAALTCTFYSSEDCRWAAILGPDGTEFTAVAFDPDTGVEDYATQRFLGLDEDELLSRANKGDPAALFTPEGIRAACLWLPSCPDFVGSSSLPGKATAEHATPEEVDVLNRQSQLLAFLVARLDPPIRASDPVVATVFTENNCTLSPDFSFTTLCCAAHDACYAKGGTPDDREDCDQAFCECITDNGYPLLARVYYAAVRAFGWPFFGASQR